MKTLILIFSMLISLSGCRDDNISDDNTDCNYKSTNKQETSTSIVGVWKLLEAKFYGLQGGTSSTGSIYYCYDNITYTFEANGVLKVEGKKDNVDHPQGVYQYEFGKFNLTYEGDGHKILIVKINGSKWTYSLNNGVMVLGKSYVDGPDLYFKRK